LDKPQELVALLVPDVTCCGARASESSSWEFEVHFQQVLDHVADIIDGILAL
jgi:hypothetical protein